MRYKTSYVYALAVSFSVLFPTCNTFGGIIFDPTGTGNYRLAVEMFDWAPGNALAKGIGSLKVNKDTSMTILYQARLNELQDSDENAIEVPGLNAANGFQITLVAGYAVNAHVSGGIVTGEMDTMEGALNYFKIFYNSTVTADDHSGAHFTDGICIYEGTINSDASMLFGVTGSTQKNLVSYTSPSPKTLPIDGSMTFDVTTDILDQDFFVDGKATVIGIESFSSRLNTPFAKVNLDDKLYMDGTGLITPNMGTVNGLGTDVRLLTDASNSFFVPEPATLGLIGLGVMGLLARRRR